MNAMNAHQRVRIGCAVAIGAALACAAAARTVEAAVTPPTDVQYLNGGIGKEQADRMRGVSAQYPVAMTFTERNQGLDEFVADVHLRVMDSHGDTLLDLASQGPIFLLRLPQGEYSVAAEHRGDVKTQRFDVVAGHRDKLVFSWS